MVSATYPALILIRHVETHIYTSEVAFAGRVFCNPDALPTWWLITVLLLIKESLKPTFIIHALYREFQRKLALEQKWYGRK